MRKAEKIVSVYVPSCQITHKVHDAVSANILTIYRKYMEDNAEETHLQEDP